MREALYTEAVPRVSAWWDEGTRALARAWDEVPAWARSPLALGLLCAFLAITFLGSLALVVNGVVERSEARQHEAALQAQAAMPLQKRAPANTALALAAAR